MSKITHITYGLVEPQIPNKPEYVITTHIETNNATTARVNYKLIGIELNPDYLTADRLYALLRRHFPLNNVVEYEAILDNFVMEFVTLIRGWAT